MEMPREQLTLDEFLKIPEREPPLEFEDGWILQKVSPKGKHSFVQAGLVNLINRLVAPSKTAFAASELRVTFAGRSYVPDVSVYRWRRIPADSNGRVSDDFREPPDVVVEILSPGQKLTSTVRRCIWYVAHGAQASLLIDPSDDVILLFRPDQVPQPLQGADIIDLSDVVEGLRLAASEIFDVLRVR